MYKEALDDYLTSIRYNQDESFVNTDMVQLVIVDYV